MQPILSVPPPPTPQQWTHQPSTPRPSRNRTPDARIPVYLAPPLPLDYNRPLNPFERDPRIRRPRHYLHRPDDPNHDSRLL